MHKDKIIQFDDLAQVLHHANLRRSTDFRHWLRQYFKDRRQAEPTEGVKAHLLNTMVSLVGPPRRRSI